MKQMAVMIAGSVIQKAIPSDIAGSLFFGEGAVGIHWN